MRWLRELLKEFSADARFRFLLGIGAVVVILILASVFWK